MPIRPSILRAAVVSAGAFATMIAVPRDADACGGCFHPPADQGSSIVTDHRMALKVSTTETILWDQVRYAGDPAEFAWVLPVHDGARIELARDAFLTALDAATKTTVYGPDVSCTPTGGGGGGSGSTVTTRSSSGGGGGCMGSSTAFSDDEGADYAGSSNVDAGAAFGAQDAGSPDVEVVSQQVVGPYQAVTIRAKAGTTSIDTWLKDNGFAIPDNVAPVIDAYTKEGFDFIALRLRPGVGVRAMRPVRVVSPGADPTLPLRMVAAGIGSHVGLTLWVISEGRYQAKSYPNAVVDKDKVAWDGKNSRSNMSQLVADALATNDGRTWLTEVAIRQNLAEETFASGNPSVKYGYEAQCQNRPPQRVPCSEASSELPPSDGTPDSVSDVDGGVDVDAGDDAGVSTPDAGTKDAGPTPQCTQIVQGCDGFDDLEVTARGLHASDVWITRLRADLPVQALDKDLALEAAPQQTEIGPTWGTTKFTDPSFDPCSNIRNAGFGGSPSSSSSYERDGGGCACRTTRIRRFRTDAGTFVLIGATALVASRIVRRKRKDRQRS